MSMELATLRRSPDAQVGGVCASLAHRYDVDPTLVRVGMLLLALSGGVGAVLYAFAWALAPQGTDTVSPFRRAFPLFPRLSPSTWTVIIVLSCLAVGGLLHSVLPFGVIGAIAILWLARWWARRYEAAAAQNWPLLRDAHPAPVPGPAPVVAPVTAPTLPARTVPARMYALPAPAVGATALPRRRGNARLAWAVLAAALTAMIADAVWQSARGAGVLSGVEALAVATVVLGLGTLAAAIKGRPRILAGIALTSTVALGATLVAASLPAPTMHHSGAGNVVAHPSTAAELSDISTGTGDVEADYSALTLSADAAMRVRTSLGDAHIVLPRGVNAVVTWHTSMGSYDGPDQHLDHGRSGTYRSVVDPARPTLTVTVTTSLGDIRVEQP